jgi:K+-transporting ATPase A subunit
MPTISLIIIIILLVILLTVFVGRASELIIMKIQQKNMQPAMEKNLDHESIQTIHQATP